MKFLFLFLVSLTSFASDQNPNFHIVGGVYERDLLKEVEILQLEGDLADKYILEHRRYRDHLGFEVSLRSSFIDIIEMSDNSYYYKNVSYSIPLDSSKCGRVASYWSMPTPIHYHGSVRRICQKSLAENTVLLQESLADTTFVFSMKRDGDIQPVSFVTDVEISLEDSSIVKITRNITCNRFVENICSVEVYKKK